MKKGFLAVSLVALLLMAAAIVIFAVTENRSAPEQKPASETEEAAEEKVIDVLTVDLGGARTHIDNETPLRMLDDAARLLREYDVVEIPLTGYAHLFLFRWLSDVLTLDPENRDVLRIRTAELPDDRLDDAAYLVFLSYLTGLPEFGDNIMDADENWDWSYSRNRLNALRWITGFEEKGYSDIHSFVRSWTIDDMDDITHFLVDYGKRLIYVFDEAYTDEFGDCMRALVGGE